MSGSSSWVLYAVQEVKGFDDDDTGHDYMAIINSTDQ